MDAPGDIVIRIRGLRNAFGRHVVHENLDLDVRRGEILGVVGARARASRLLLALDLRCTPTDGSVTVLHRCAHRRRATRSALKARLGA